MIVEFDVKSNRCHENTDDRNMEETIKVPICVFGIKNRKKN
jgi:hypothetical protein